MKINRIISLLLIGVLSLCLFCACAPEEEEVPYPQVIATDKNGNEYTEEIFSYYAHYVRDMMESSFKSSTYYYYFSGNFASYLEMFVDEEQTTPIYQYALNLAESQYSDYLVVEKMFDELHLTFDDETQANINSYLKSFRETISEEQISTLCGEIGISEDDLLNILVYHSYKAIALQNYYCGAGGNKEIKTSDIQKYYDTNYYRFRYVALTKYGSDNKKLGESDLALLAQKANTVLDNAQNGADFTEMIKSYSAGYLSEETINATIESYKKENELSEEKEKQYRELLAASNEELITQGMICDTNGIYDYSAYTSSGYTVDSDIVDKLKTMQIGEYAKVETDTYIWIIEKRDINESSDYVNLKANEIRSTLASEVMDEFYTFWKSQLKLSFVVDVVAKYDPRNMTTLSWMK